MTNYRLSFDDMDLSEGEYLEDSLNKFAREDDFNDYNMIPYNGNDDHVCGIGALNPDKLKTWKDDRNVLMMKFTDSLRVIQQDATIDVNTKSMKTAKLTMLMSKLIISEEPSNCVPELNVPEMDQKQEPKEEVKGEPEKNPEQPEVDHEGGDDLGNEGAHEDTNGGGVESTDGDTNPHEEEALADETKDEMNRGLMDILLKPEQ